jgi:hypothetical protein
MFININNLFKYFNNNLSEEENTYLNTEPDMVTEIFVIKRQLNKFHIKIAFINHSALLLKTINKYFILEYGSDSEDLQNRVLLRELKNIQVLKYSVLEENYTWDKKDGRSLKKSMHVSKIFDMMQQNIINRKYNVYYWNCHMAQERTRKQLGLDVPIKYEYVLILIIFYFLIFIFFSSLRIFDSFSIINEYEYEY